MISASEITLRPYRCASELAPLRSQWNALAGGVVFRSYDWLESWWRAYGEGQRAELLALAAFDADGRLVGIAPWYLDRAASQRVIRFLGSGEVCSDYLTVLCQPGSEEGVTGALADWLCDANNPSSDRLGGNQRWDELELGVVHGADRSLSRLVAHLRERGNFVHRRPRQSCWRIELPKNWNQYLAMLSKSHRKQLRRLQRAYFATGRARLHTVENQQDLEQGLDLLTRLHQRRRQSLGDRGCFASARFAEFHRDTAGRLFQSGHLRLAWLDLDGSPVAVEYQIAGDGVVYAYQSGIEPTALAHQPGRLITMATLERAIADGYRAFDFLRGDEAYKAHWRAQPRPTEEVHIVSNTLRGRWRHRLWLAGGNVRRLFKHAWLGVPQGSAAVELTSRVP